MSGGLHGSAALIGTGVGIVEAGLVWLLLHIGNRKKAQR